MKNLITQLRFVSLLSLTLLVCAAAYSQSVTGSGTASYIPIWTGSSTLADSKLFQVGNDVGIDTTTPQYALDVTGFINSSRGYRIGENLVLTTPASSLGANLAVGYNALIGNTSGFSNTAIGNSALDSNNTGFYNTASGFNALYNNTSGSSNTANGTLALQYNTIGTSNTATGFAALYENIQGNGNTADGTSALDLSTGSNNTAIGNQALEDMRAGSYNIAIGYQASFGFSGSESNNIQIGNGGYSGDNGTIRIGSGSQTSFFAAGIYGVSSESNSAVPVLIDSSGQLVTVSSSRRYKEDIQDMGDASRGLMQLRPVTFRYKKPLADGSQPLQYGLIAEEVAEVYPDLVAYSADGQVETVKYQLLNSMLLNEVQRQQTEIGNLEERLAKLEAALASMTPLRATEPRP